MKIKHQQWLINEIINNGVMAAIENNVGNNESNRRNMCENNMALKIWRQLA